MSDWVPAEGATEAVQAATLQFNRREFWECHETLEDVWGAEQGPLRDFYHGIIQVAAGFVHVQRGNWHGAVRLLGEGGEKLAGYRPHCLGVDVEQLYRETMSWRRALALAGPDGMAAAVLPGFPELKPALDSR